MNTDSISRYRIYTSYISSYIRRSENICVFWILLDDVYALD